MVNLANILQLENHFSASMQMLVNPMVRREVARRKLERLNDTDNVETAKLLEEGIEIDVPTLTYNINKDKSSSQNDALDEIIALANVVKARAVNPSAETKAI